ncbi:Os12g0638750 [Oryza sativa Japonica Group]|uniref:Os12g0638750 protein n=1 Tax=Oryza sativa subsp. japonica TaxID=39947 RepID=A0A0P0YD04_ORYSJ|nr:hypothetical protein EE612_061166 [Oryza sativa]BAT18278.1 Os12g0638750 [Oryza sativa Japonica Group]
MILHNGKNLIDLQRISLKETRICRYNVSKFNTYDIPWYKDGRLFLMNSIKGKTLAFGARRAMSAAAALPALFSSMKLIVELITRRVMIPTKSCQSGGFPPPFASAMAMIAAASMTHESGFHMNPKNLRNLLSCQCHHQTCWGQRFRGAAAPAEL